MPLPTNPVKYDAACSRLPSVATVRTQFERPGRGVMQPEPAASPGAQHGLEVARLPTEIHVSHVTSTVPPPRVAPNFVPTETGDDEGSRPERTANRDGVHTGTGTCAPRKSAPRRPTPEIAGAVYEQLACPVAHERPRDRSFACAAAPASSATYAGTRSRSRSSIRTTTTFGGRASAMRRGSMVRERISKREVAGGEL